MNITQLQYFAKTVQLGSYTAAAKTLFLSPPGISRAVGELEKELHIKLVERDGKHIKPTMAGTILYENVVQILNEVIDLRAIAESLSSPNQNSGSVSIAIATMPYRGTIIHQNVIDSFHKIYPEINLTVFKSTSGTCLSALNEGVVQAAIVLGRTTVGDLLSIKLFSIQLKLAISKDHPLAKLRKISNDDLVNYPIALPSDLRYCYPQITKRLIVDGRQPNYVAVQPSKQSHIDFMNKEMGLIFVAPDLGLRALYPNAVFMSLQDIDLSIPVCFAYRTEEQESIVSAVKRHFILMAKTETRGLKR